MPGRFRLLGVMLLAVAVSSCAPRPTTPPPANLQEYLDMQTSRRTSYPRQTILLYNLQRVLDRQLDAASRTASMKIVTEMGGEDPLVLEQLAGVLGDAQTPQMLRDEVLAFLLKKDYPELAQYVVKVLPHIRGSSQLRSVLLDWLARHPTPAVLSEVVRAWAEIPPGAGAEEAHFRLIVERLANKPWDQALLEAVNAPGFTARGSAIEVLGRRIEPTALKNCIVGMTPRTEAVVVLQTFIHRFDVLPTTGQELGWMAYVYRTQKDKLPAVAELSTQWGRQYGYRFNIRDFHLLSRLAEDSRRSAVPRAELVADLSKNLLKRRHVRHHLVAVSQEDPATRFDRLVNRLTMADLWNLQLLNEMLSRVNIQAAIAVMAEEDRSDRLHAFGGLVFLGSQQAQAMRYPADPQAPADDLTYVPSSQALGDGRDALCWFYGHFEALRNARRAGPGREELTTARKNNAYLLILTSLSETAFCAHYVNPEGVVVSLGSFPLVR